MNRRVSLFSLAAVAAAAALGACDCGAPPDGLPAGNICGTGAVDGVDYAVAEKGNEVVITVHKNDAFGCGALHSHVVLATQIGFEYDLDSAGAGQVKITVPAVGLDPDDKDLRLKYLPDGENQELSDGDRSSIRGSVAEEVKAEEFADLVFVLKDLSTIDGTGTAKLVSTIAGADSTVDVGYNARKDGDDVTISGTATIDGAPHGIPRNALGFCVDPIMELTFKVVLTPGTQACDIGGAEPVVFTETEFPDDACGDVGFNVVYNNVIGPRCMGCHGGTLPSDATKLRGGATVPLAEWLDFRVDSLRNQGRPLYETADGYVSHPETGGISMPPQPGADSDGTPIATQLQPELIDRAGVPDDIISELDLWSAWIAAGARDVQCENDVEKKVFDHAAPAADCDAVDAIHFDTPGDPADEFTSPRGFVEGNCLYCHSNGNELQAPSAPPVGNFDADLGADIADFAAGNVAVTMPFYVAADGSPLTFWEAAVPRVDDGSMFPDSTVLGFDGDVGYEQYKAWIAGGACE